MRITAESLCDVLPPGGLTFVQGCSGHSDFLEAAAMQAGATLGPMTFTGVFVPGLNRATWLANPACRVETFFMTPELRAAGGGVTLLPFCYADVLAHLRHASMTAALFMVAPPDAHGMCSFGPVADFLAEFWPQIPVRIAHINPHMPVTHGQIGIPFDRLAAFVEQEQPLAGMAAAPPDAVAAAIGRHVAAFVHDGATLQTGLGKIPDAVLRSLSGRRNLRLHTGLVGDGVLDLLDAGAMADGASIVAGVAIGSPRLYGAISSPRFEFRPVSFTHDAATIALIANFVAVNSAFAVDLFGQAYAELGPAGLSSGPGGASEFARGARMAGGLRIVVLPSDAARGAQSRIVAPAEGAGPVSLGRMDTDIVVTEHGAADLRGLDHDQRARCLIAIAAPAHRDRLADAWHLTAARF